MLGQAWELNFGGSVNEGERVEAIMNSHASPVLINHVHYPEIPGLAACLPCKSYGELTSPYPELPATVTALVASSAALLNKHSWGQSPWDTASSEIPVSSGQTGGRGPQASVYHLR